MGPGPRKEAAGTLRRVRLAVALVVAVGAVAPAAADPILRPPEPGRGVLTTDDDGRARTALLVEVAAIGVVAAEPLTRVPGIGVVDALQPELVVGRVGLISRLPRVPLLAVVRADLAELDRITLDELGERPVAVIDRVLDDAALWWRPTGWAELIAGRVKVPFSRFVHIERALLTAGVEPFAVERLAPNRRWGVTVHGDLGALSYAGGLYEDLDRLEPRTAPGDPSIGGRALAAGHLEWTPRAPIGRDHLPTPPDDPWYDTVRVSAGLGALLRIDQDSGLRTDVSGNLQLQWTRFGGLVEGIVSQADEGSELAVTGELSAFVTDRVALFGRAEVEVAQDDDRWTAGAGASWYATEDRRNKVLVYGWARRGLATDQARRDGLIVLLQAVL